MKILKLYEHKSNPGGIVNFQLDLEKYFNKSKNTYFHFRTGRIFYHPILSLRLFRFLDLLFSYFYFPFFLLKVRPESIEFNTSLIKKSFIRDFIYLMESKIICPKSKKIVFIHGWDQEFEVKLASKYPNILKHFTDTADDFIVLARGFKKELLKTGVDDKKIHVFTTGIDVKSFSKINKTNFQKENILFLSRLEEDKGIKEFLESIPLIIEQKPNVHFDIAGKGEFENSIFQSKIFHKYKDQISFHGYLTGEKKIQLLKNATIFVFPSYHGEGFPISILEAMASGLPLIYTSTGALSERLKDGVNGIVIPKKDHYAIAKAVVRLLDDKIYLNKINTVLNKI